MLGSTIKIYNGDEGNNLVISNKNEFLLNFRKSFGPALTKYFSISIVSILESSSDHSQWYVPISSDLDYKKYPSYYELESKRQKFWRSIKYGSKENADDIITTVRDSSNNLELELGSVQLSKDGLKFDVHILWNKEWNRILEIFKSEVLEKYLDFYVPLIFILLYVDIEEEIEDNEKDRLPRAYWPNDFKVSTLAGFSKISIPEEPVFYYECSNGSFRLTYFVPLKTLKELILKDLIKAQAIQDFPDGIDLDCTEPDYAEFKREYGWRPKHSPLKIHYTFLAVFSSSKNWKNFEGTGYIPVNVLKKNIRMVEDTLNESNISFESNTLKVIDLKKEKKRSSQLTKTRLINTTNKIMEKLFIEEVDKSLSLKKQKFGPIKMEEGMENTKDFFELLELKKWS